MAFHERPKQEPRNISHPTDFYGLWGCFGKDGKTVKAALECDTQAYKHEAISDDSDDP
jgi:hypothetical protein